jgi:GGDEF domain-containing protein
LATDLICKKLKNAVSETIQLPSGGVVTIGASVGQALYADNGMDLDKMLVAADQSMYACKAVALKAMNAHSSPGAKAPQTTMH